MPASISKRRDESGKSLKNRIVFHIVLADRAFRRNKYKKKHTTFNLVKLFEEILFDINKEN